MDVTRSRHIAVVAGDISTETSLGCHDRREMILAHRIEKVTAAVHQDVVVSGLEQVIDILRAPQADHRLWAVDYIPQAEYVSGCRHFFADEGKGFQQFTFHAGRGMIYQEHVGTIANDRLQDYCLTAGLYCCE